jgi:hypothetical protein
MCDLNKNYLTVCLYEIIYSFVSLPGIYLISAWPQNYYFKYNIQYYVLLYGRSRRLYGGVPGNRSAQPARLNA